MIILSRFWRSAPTSRAARRQMLVGLLLAAGLPQGHGALAQPNAPASGRAGTPVSRAGGAPAHGEAPSDLIAQASEGYADGKPLVVMFSLRGCPWCDALRREHFDALEKRQDSERVLAVELDMLDTRPFNPLAPQMRAPSWAAASPRELARQHRVRLAPTILFLGPHGEVAERLVGYGSPDFFGAYLEQRLGEARSALSRR